MIELDAAHLEITVANAHSVKRVKTIFVKKERGYMSLILEGTLLTFNFSQGLYTCSQKVDNKF